MKHITTYFLAYLALLPTLLWAQQGVTQCGTPTNQPIFPILQYEELPNHEPSMEKEWATIKGVKATWGNTNIRYKKNKPLNGGDQKLKINAWKGEKINAQAVVYSGTDVDHLSYTLSEFRTKEGKVLPATAFSGGFIRYVMADQVNKDGKGGCGQRPDHSIFDSTLVADGIDHLSKELRLKAKNTQPIWISCKLPEDAAAGTYQGNLIIKEGEKAIHTLKLDITVSKRALGTPSEWTHHLDLWQSPFAIARYYQVPLWSNEHFEAMRPLMQMLVDAGQNVITASITHKPWDGQTQDYFDAMVTWMKRADGTWTFDYTVFDKWVEFMTSLGVKGQINCYSMIPWKLSFRYIDQATNSFKSIAASPGEPAYDEMWLAMLRSFSQHLHQKGWFERCVISMDERPMKTMQQVIALIHQADSNFKVSLAGNYYEELEKDIFDYSIAWGSIYPPDVLKRRQKANLVSTYYSCCTEVWPNMFTFSEPAEVVWTNMVIAKDGVDGYLRWAYNSWPLEPLLDSRFRSFASGDTYMVYPGGRSSIRFEKMIEGIQTYEKVILLRKEFAANGDKNGSKNIEKILSVFNQTSLSPKATREIVEKAINQLNKL